MKYRIWVKPRKIAFQALRGHGTSIIFSVAHRPAFVKQVCRPKNLSFYGLTFVTVCGLLILTIVRARLTAGAPQHNGITRQTYNRVH